MPEVRVPKVTNDGASTLDQYLHETVGKRVSPAIFMGITNSEETIYLNQEGERNFGHPEDGMVNENTPTEMFSQTKMVTCIAALQLVDRGAVSLDSVEDIEKWLPEIGKLPLLKGYDEQDKPILDQPKNKVTLRMLMSHTAGCTYSHADPFLAKWLALNPLPTLFSTDSSVKILCTPFVYEPGTSWRYSHSIDWVGVLIERVSGKSLEDYFQEYLFKPCGITSMTFLPNDHVKQNKMAVCIREPDGSIHQTANGWGMGRSTNPEKVKKALYLGGAGLFGNQKDFLALLRGILQSNPKLDHPNPLIGPGSYAELWKHCVSTSPGHDGTEKLAAMVSRPEYFDPPQVAPEDVNHSVAFMLNLKPWEGRRKVPSGAWSGAAKTNFWIDPVTGIGAIIGTQLLSPAPDPWYPVYKEFERLVYAALE